MANKTVLLIWEVIPEETHLFMLSELSQADFDRVCACHKWYINAGDWEKNQENLNWLSVYLTKGQEEAEKHTDYDTNPRVAELPMLQGKPYYLTAPEPGELAGKTTSFHLSGIDAIVHSGFIL